MFQELMAKKNQALFNLATRFFCEELGLTHEEQGLITVQEVKRLEAGTSGTCTGIYVGPKNLLERVEIRILGYASIMGMIDVLAHELVHARQHVRGEFYFENRKHPIFFGLLKINVREKFHKEQRLLTTEYYDRHCEIEAHTLSYELITKFCASLAKAGENIKTESKMIEDDSDGTELHDEGTETREIEEGSILGLS